MPQQHSSTFRPPSIHSIVLRSASRYNLPALAKPTPCPSNHSPVLFEFPRNSTEVPKSHFQASLQPPPSSSPQTSHQIMVVLTTNFCSHWLKFETDISSCTPPGARNHSTRFSRLIFHASRVIPWSDQSVSVDMRISASLTFYASRCWNVMWNILFDIRARRCADEVGFVSRFRRRLEFHSAYVLWSPSDHPSTRFTFGVSSYTRSICTNFVLFRTHRMRLIILTEFGLKSPDFDETRVFFPLRKKGMLASRYADTFDFLTRNN